MKQQNLFFLHLMAALTISTWAVATQPAAAADISALLARAAAADKGGDPAATIKALEEALETVRVAAPLTVKPLESGDGDSANHLEIGNSTPRLRSGPENQTF